jgi:hypothetical protein
MKLSARDFTRLRWSLIFLVVALIAGAGLVLFSRHWVAQAEQRQHQLAARQKDIRSQLNHAQEEEQEIRSRIARHQFIMASGIVNQEERLNWVEQIARIKVARRLLELQYELSPQHVIDETVLPGASPTGGYEFMASTMKLQMALLHEDDLLGFLADLRQSVHALLLVRKCSILPTPTTPSERGPSPQLRAECTIDWITLREKKS